MHKTGQRAGTRRPPRALSLLAGASGVLIASTGWVSYSPQASATAKASSTATVEIGGPLTSLDPAKGGSYQDVIAATALYSPLVIFDQSGKIIPDLATSWSVTSSSATFHIRTGVTCSDGTAVTPAVVANSLSWFLAPSTGAAAASLVVGSGNSAKVTANEKADTVTIALAHPWSQLLAGLALPLAGIVCPAGIKDPSSLATHSDGTGPYVSSSEVPGASYTFKRRSGYNWGPSYPGQPSGTAPQTLVYKVVTDENTASDLQETGGLDIATYGTNDWAHLQTSSGFSHSTQLQSDTMLIFNEAPGHPTAKKSVRLAIAQAVDRSGMAKIIGNGTPYLENNVGKSTYACYNSSVGALIPKYDPSAAAKVLAGLKLRLIGSTIIGGGDATSYLLAELQAAGASATLDNMDNSAWVTDLFSGKNDWDVTILVTFSLGNNFLSPAASYLTGSAPPKGIDVGNVNNPQALAAATAAGRLTGSAECSATTAFQRALLTRTDVVPLAAAPETVVFSKGYAGVAVDGFIQASTIRLTH